MMITKLTLNKIDEHNCKIIHWCKYIVMDNSHTKVAEGKASEITVERSTLTHTNDLKCCHTSQDKHNTMVSCNFQY